MIICCDGAIHIILKAEITLSEQTYSESAFLSCAMSIISSIKSINGSVFVVYLCLQMVYDFVYRTCWVPSHITFVNISFWILIEEEIFRLQSFEVDLEFISRNIRTPYRPNPIKSNLPITPKDSFRISIRVYSIFSDRFIKPVEGLWGDCDTFFVPKVQV